MLSKLYASVVFVILTILGCGCGDVIKARNPTKRMDIPEPEVKSSDLYGHCVNFHEHWTVQCPTQKHDFPSSFYLVQQYCDRFIIQEARLYFERDTVAWSDTRDNLTLKSGSENLVLQKQGAARYGSWSRGQQSCSLTWAP